LPLSPGEGAAGWKRRADLSSSIGGRTMKLNSLDDLLVEQLEDLYDAVTWDV
jgi:hypothetical protein